MTFAFLLSLLCVSAMNFQSLGGKVDILGKESQEAEAILSGDENQPNISTLDLLSRLHHRGILNSSHFSFSLLPPTPFTPSPKMLPMFSILSKTSYTTLEKGIPPSPTTQTPPTSQNTHLHTIHNSSEDQEENLLINLDNPSNYNYSLNTFLSTNDTHGLDPVSQPVSESFFIGLNKTELAVSAGALLLLLLTSVVILLAYFLCRSQFTRRNIYTTMDEHEFNPVCSHFTNPGPPIILDHEHRGFKPKRR
ncbi:unnamed protein product [Lepeophtheirus salmonis]|uniref:(salmon louse) hypothetical protein n=1 Tax=Lepeophtheirus salmonis TaxID=72036 RepID=A0A7R8CD68_LEPSM|nr:unnamed protein product [Lepeophtheirus salmonis]CAF2778162.1 unnamed protein product [Lepeophtheirus salmonis]